MTALTMKTLIERLDECWPDIDPDFNWRELNDESQALVLACALVLASPFASLHPDVVIKAAWDVLNSGYRECAP